MPEPVSGSSLLRQRTVPAAGDLVESLRDNWVRCWACGHACKIPPGRAGICQVRFNDAGTLRVPHGYVGALACDPIEKKPFFHVLPGTEALSFGMLGCDLHCAYCFPGDTSVATDRGPMAIEDVFRAGKTTREGRGARIATDCGLRAVSGSGRLRAIQAVFEHKYQGDLLTIQPMYLPPLRLTPDHRVYATTDPGLPPQPVQARNLTSDHWLAVPRRHVFGERIAIDVATTLAGIQVTHRVHTKLSADDRAMILTSTERGATSREIGALLGTSGSSIRHMRRRLRLGKYDPRVGGVLVEEERVRFPREHRPGIPRELILDADLARLLGFYCAEGCTLRGSDRPNSLRSSFCFSHQETQLAEEIVHLLKKTFGIRASLTWRETTLAVSFTKASLAAFFRSQCGGRAVSKRVPPPIFDAPPEIVAAFLNAYVQGDGHRYPNGKVHCTTVSKELAHGIAFLVLRLGWLPSIYDMTTGGSSTIQGRSVRTAPNQYSVVWYESDQVLRRSRAVSDFHLVPIRDISRGEFQGLVYNMQVEDEHNYLAGFFLVSNCQNWETSQVGRDSAAQGPPRPITATGIVELALRYGAPTVASTYNEPLITSEWAVDVFRVAKKAGLRTAYISNGNGTDRVLDYLQPWVDFYKVDLKSFQDRSYRQLGGRLDRILDTIPKLVERGFWVEIVTLLIPGFNDSDAEVTDMASYLAGISPDIPWHLTAFHKDYRMTDPQDTPAETLVRACDIGRRAGLRFVYAGNRPGRVGDLESTRCAACGGLLVERRGYTVRQYRLLGDRCPDCGVAVPGRWRG